MQAVPSNGNGNVMEPSAHAVLPSAMVFQPWWQTAGYNPAVFQEGPSKAPTSNIPSEHGSAKGDKSLTEESPKEVVASKGMQDAGREEEFDRSCGQEQQHIQSITSSVPPMMPDYLAPHTQLELGQSVACAPYPFTDPYYSGVMAPYGNQAMIHPQFLGMPQSRVPLPLEMVEEPVFVNAKQYHGILRRRQSRAKAELEKKVIKVRKPYLHESRHQHAMRRARGCGGRFLNTKKTDDSSTTPSRGVNNSSESMPLDHVQNPGQEMNKQDQNDSGTMDGCKDDHNDNRVQNRNSQVPGVRSVSSERVENGDCSGQRWNGIRMNGPSVVRSLVMVCFLIGFFLMHLLSWEKASARHGKRHPFSQRGDSVARQFILGFSFQLMSL